MCQVVGGRAVDAQAASASQMGRFETETLALPENRAALGDLNGQAIITSKTEGHLGNVGLCLFHIRTCYMVFTKHLN